MKNLDKFKKKVDAAEKILLITHQNPDGDALGATSALFYLLRNYGKKVTAVCRDEIPKLFCFINGIKKFKRDFLIGDYDLIIILDCGDLKRTGFIDRLKNPKLKKRKIINIDHHPKNDVHRIASLNLVDYDSSSTAEIVYDIANELDLLITRDIATSLLCGIYTDTGAFQHSNTSPAVLKIASVLMHRGAQLKKISQNITNGKSVSALKLWGVVLSRVRKIKSLGLIISVVTQQDIENCQATVADLAGVVNLINTIPGSKASILFSEIENGNIKASLRTECNNIDVSKIAKLFGGGGLKKASGFTISGRVMDDENGGWKIVDYKI